MNSRIRESPILIRWGTALIAVTFGWFFLMTSLAIRMALPPLIRAPKPVVRMGLYRFVSGMFIGLGPSALVGGIFCLAAWIIVGLPLAIWNPKFSSRARVFTATMLSGGIGLLMFSFVFRPSRLTFNVFPLLAFLTAAVSMLVYVRLLESFKARIS